MGKMTEKQVNTLANIKHLAGSICSIAADGIIGWTTFEETRKQILNYIGEMMTQLAVKEEEKVRIKKGAEILIRAKIVRDCPDSLPIAECGYIISTSRGEVMVSPEDIIESKERFENDS